MEIQNLRQPFRKSELDWRIARTGKSGKGPWAVALCYVDARAIMRRLDDVCGAMNWKDEYIHKSEGVLCKLSVWDSDKSEWVTKENGSPETQVEAFKGGISKAFVRAAVNWGVGRYLYELPETYVDVSLERKSGYRYAKDKQVGVFYWKEPTLEAKWYGK